MSNDIDLVKEYTHRPLILTGYDECLEELERELKYRKSAYPHQIKDGLITKDQANKRYLALLYAYKILDLAHKDTPKTNNDEGIILKSETPFQSP